MVPLDRVVEARLSAHPSTVDSVETKESPSVSLPQGVLARRRTLQHRRARGQRSSRHAKTTLSVQDLRQSWPADRAATLQAEPDQGGIETIHGHAKGHSR